MQSYNYILTGIEDIELSSEERSYYMERFGQNVVPFSQLKMTQTVGEGISTLSAYRCKYIFI